METPGHKEKSYLYKGFLRDNAKALANKSMAGMFNVILIFGPTRYGKSTLSFQLAAEISMHCGVPFDDKTNIQLEADKLIEVASEGKRHHVYVLDEGAFDLKGEDWQGKANKALRKFFNTAAKYNQTFIINIPFIGSLHRDFVRDDHARGIRVNVAINKNAKDPKDMYKRGYCKGYKENLMYQWHGCKANIPHSELWKWRADIPVSRFGKDISFIDEDAYQEKKDEAIKKLNEEKKGLSDVHENYISKLANYLKNEVGLTYEQISHVMGGVSTNTVGKYVRRLRNEKKVKNTKKKPE